MEASVVTDSTLNVIVWCISFRVFSLLHKEDTYRTSRQAVLFSYTPFTEIQEFLLSAARLHKIATKVQSHVTKRAKPKKVEDETVRRRSMRLQRVEPSGVPVPEIPARPEAEEYPRVPAGPLSMVPENQMENSKLTEEFLTMWTRISETKPNDTEKRTCDVERYRASLNSMTLSEDNVKKVVKNRIYSMAIHPSESTIFVAAGDKFGQIGLWNVNCKTEEGAHVFIPHNYPVSCMYFSPFNPAHLLSLSYDSLRCGDVTRAVFDEICLH
uniref:WD repeat-containing protein 76 n=1 Tax=Apteryx owenii TaxID=8824 RepID=A0A8B9PES4_APTOW